MMNLKKEGVLANLHFMRIYLLILRKFIVKELFSWLVKIFH
jgi:hypothetical protein